MITSPNHPATYPHNLKKTEYVTVKKGKILRLEFTAFAVYVGGSIDTCPTDFVRITDGDGTTLMDNSCGYLDRDPSDGYHFQPPIITSKTNKVDIYFHTDWRWSSTGWSLSWTAVAEGECYHRGCVISTSDCPPWRVLLPTFLFCQKKLFVCCWHSCDMEQLKCFIALQKKYFKSLFVTGA